jgi:hypothetical protein
MEAPEHNEQKIGGLNITRSVQDRIFLGVIGFIFMVLTGFMLYAIHTIDLPQDESTTFKGALFLYSEIALTVFILAFNCFIWGVAAPQWLEHFFHKVIRKFIWMLAFIASLLLVLVGYIFYLNL